MTTTPLLLLHGALYTRREFAPLIDALAARGRHAQAIDLPGHGERAGEIGEFSIAAFGAATIAWLDAQSIARADVFGYSMGGYVALWLARHQPARVGRVFTLATKLEWSPAIAARETAKLDPDAIAAKVPAFAATLAARHGEPHWRTLLSRTATLMSGLGDSPALVPADFAAIAAPVRLAVGDRDMMVTLDETAAVYRQLPHGELQVFPATPHPLEKAPLAPLADAIVARFSA